jgi:FG-GAP repeat
VKRTNPEYRVVPTRLGRTLTAVAAAAVVASAAADPPPGGENPPPSLMALLLPSAVGTSNRATCAIDLGVDYANPDVRIGGAAQDSPSDGESFGVSKAAYWTMTAAGIAGPNFLPQPAGGGIVNAVTVGSRDGDDAIYFVGGVGGGTKRPSLWTVGPVENATLTILPSDTNRGEALSVAVADLNGDGFQDLAVCGYTYDAAGNRVATAWFGAAGSHTFHEFELPTAAGGPGSTANALLSDGTSNVLISGAIDLPGGGRSAALWTISDSNVSVQRVGELPPGNGSLARTETVGANETLTIGGVTSVGNGVSRPTVWMDIAATGNYESRILPTGLNPNGRVNSIIAILIGLLVAGDTNGPGGSSAVVWSLSDAGDVRMFDLNSITRRPPGTRLTSACCLLPYMEQDNLFRVVGNATDRNGVSRGFIAGR